MKVKNDCKCRYCHWYRPKKGLRCYGFRPEDRRGCIKEGYRYFKGRDLKYFNKG